MLTIQQMMRAIRDLQKRVEALEAADKPVVVVDPPVRRGRPPKVATPDTPEPVQEI